MRVVSSLSRDVSPCVAVDCYVAVSTDAWRTGGAAFARSVDAVGFFTDAHGQAVVGLTRAAELSVHACVPSPIGSVFPGAG
jgi:hypothetical protein